MSKLSPQALASMEREQLNQLVLTLQEEVSMLENELVTEQLRQSSYLSLEYRARVDGMLEALTAIAGGGGQASNHEVWAGQLVAIAKNALKKFHMNCQQDAPCHGQKQ